MRPLMPIMAWFMALRTSGSCGVELTTGAAELDTAEEDGSALQLLGAALDDHALDDHELDEVGSAEDDDDQDELDVFSSVLVVSGGGGDQVDDGGVHVEVGGGGGGVQVVVGGGGGGGSEVVGLGLGGAFEVVGAGAGFWLPSLKVHEPVSTPTDSSAKKSNRPRDMSRPPYGQPGH
jgi:hypothetical protein